MAIVSQPQYIGYSGPENNANAKVWRIHTLTESGFSVKPDEWSDIGDGMIGIAYAFSVGII